MNKRDFILKNGVLDIQELNSFIEISPYISDVTSIPCLAEVILGEDIFYPESSILKTNLCKFFPEGLITGKHSLINCLRVEIYSLFIENRESLKNNDLSFLPKDYHSLLDNAVFSIIKHDNYISPINPNTQYILDNNVILKKDLDAEKAKEDLFSLLFNYKETSIHNILNSISEKSKEKGFKSILVKNGETDLEPEDLRKEDPEFKQEEVSDKDSVQDSFKEFLDMLEDAVEEGKIKESKEYLEEEVFKPIFDKSVDKSKAFGEKVTNSVFNILNSEYAKQTKEKGSEILHNVKDSFDKVISEDTVDKTKQVVSEKSLDALYQLGSLVSSTINKLEEDMYKKEQEDTVEEEVSMEEPFNETDIFEDVLTRLEKSETLYFLTRAFNTGFADVKDLENAVDFIINYHETTVSPTTNVEKESFPIIYTTYVLSAFTVIESNVPFHKEQGIESFTFEHPINRNFYLIYENM